MRAMTDTATLQSPAGALRAAFIRASAEESSAYSALEAAKAALAAAEARHKAAQIALVDAEAPLLAQARQEAEAQGAVFSGEEGEEGISENIEVKGSRGYVRAWCDSRGLTMGIWWAFLWDGGCDAFRSRSDAEAWVRSRTPAAVG